VISRGFLSRLPGPLFGPLAAGLLALAAVAATTAAPLAAQQAAPPGPATTPGPAGPTPSPVPTPLVLDGWFRSYYFTRQNASNNPGTQFDFAPGAKYNSNAVNQASWNNAVALHARYQFPDGPWVAGVTYFYANPIDGPCSVAANHAKDATYPSPPCTMQVPPNLNPDDGLPGFTMSTFIQAYLGYQGYNFSGKVGNQLFDSPWANPSDTFLKPVAFQGADLSFSGIPHWFLEGADMWAFENRTSNTFTSNTLLTSYPAGSPGVPGNINFPGGLGITSPGFGYAKVGYSNAPSGLSFDGYYYGVTDIANMWWFDGQYTYQQSRWRPFLAVQGGLENNNGTSYIGTIRSQDIGAEIGANVAKGVVFTVGYDNVPWRSTTLTLPKDVSCNDTNYQISAKGATLPYFLPLNAGQCYTNAATGLTSIYYGGWASPYTDSYGSDPFFTTSITQGQPVRRSPGSSWKVAATYVTPNQREVFTATNAWYDYGNALVPQNTKLWTLDEFYRFMRVPQSGPYRGLEFRYRYIERAQSNTYCGAAATNCLPGTPIGTSYLGGLPIFKYNRFMLEYDF
jgi:hypothetical protein